MKTNYNLNDLISNEEKLPIQFQKTWNKNIKESQSDSHISVLIDHDFLKNNCILRLDKTNSKEI